LILEGGITELKRIALVAAALLVASCAGTGPIYWTRPAATPEIFRADHEPCFRDATIGYGIGSEKAYKACMLQKGWTRVQGFYVNEAPTVPHFRGPEGDDEFTPADGARFSAQGTK
jgi:hypothetical protein